MAPPMLAQQFVKLLFTMVTSLEFSSTNMQPPSEPYLLTFPMFSKQFSSILIFVTAMRVSAAPLLEPVTILMVFFTKDLAST